MNTLREPQNIVPRWKLDRWFAVTSKMSVAKMWGAMLRQQTRSPIASWRVGQLRRGCVWKEVTWQMHIFKQSHWQGCYWCGSRQVDLEIQMCLQKRVCSVGCPSTVQSMQVEVSTCAWIQKWKQQAWRRQRWCLPCTIIRTKTANWMPCYAPTWMTYCLPTSQVEQR